MRRCTAGGHEIHRIEGQHKAKELVLGKQSAPVRCMGTERIAMVTLLTSK